MTLIPYDLRIVLELFVCLIILITLIILIILIILKSKLLEDDCSSNLKVDLRQSKRTVALHSIMRMLISF